MPKKPSAHLTVQVDETNLKRAQKLSGSKALSTEEEHAVRMRHGVSVSKNAPLARKDEGMATLRIQLDQLEVEAFRAMGHIYGLKRPAALPGRAGTKAALQKDKIIRALKRK
jgi:hypothetical protein